MNRVLEGRPDGLTVTTHLCRGNLRSSWMAEGSYDFVAEALFSGLEVDGFFLEYDDERSGASRRCVSCRGARSSCSASSRRRRARSSARTT